MGSILEYYFINKAENVEELLVQYTEKDGDGILDFALLNPIPTLKKITIISLNGNIS